jgi:N-acetylglucosaminyl-diphospho-decaprenol L-rhamnosyltransferase
MDSCLLSLVLVSWNTCDLLGNSIQSIGQYPPAGPFEVWVVDNASDDGSAAMVRERFPWVQLIENRENVGFAAANNQAIRDSRGRYIALLNSDTELRPGALDALLDFMQVHPRAGAAGPRLLNPDGSLQPSCQPMPTPERELWRLLFLDRLWPRATYRMHRWAVDTPRRVDVIKGACLLLRREALDQVGLLDERYFMYSEEVDLCYRLALAGWERWWVPGALVMHTGGQSTRQMAETMHLQLYRSKVQFYRKYGGQRRALRFKRLVRLAYWPRLIMTIPCAAFRASLAPRVRLYRQILAQLPSM